MVEFLVCLGQTTKWWGQNSKYNCMSTWMLCFPHCAVPSIRSSRELVNTAGSWIPCSLFLSPWVEVQGYALFTGCLDDSCAHEHLNTLSNGSCKAMTGWSWVPPQRGWLLGEPGGCWRRWPLSCVFKDDYLFTQREWKGEHFRQKEDSQSSHRVRKE